MQGTRFIVAVATVAILGSGTAWAQLVVTDPATTGRSAVTAGLKQQILETLTTQHERLEQMAKRLSVYTSLDQFRAQGAPDGRRPDTYGHLSSPFGEALRAGDASGAAFSEVARSRRSATEALALLTPRARAAMQAALATLDAADSTLILGTHQAGRLRANAVAERRGIDLLEAQALDPSLDQSATAVLGKLSGAALIETRQKQARLQLLASMVEQLLVDNKRARDTEAATLNMRLRQLRGTGDEGGGLMTGAANDLRTWRQP